MYSVAVNELDHFKFSLVANLKLHFPTDPKSFNHATDVNF